jgi:BirA family transcriptional regulator, biotin operon repressor / biotin---[acetyl-CoA-carboxylase] ligase
MIIHRPPFTIHHHPTLGSTQDELKRMAGAPEFTCVTADEQTAGRGRRARAWLSTPGDGLYLSVLLRPALPPHLLPLVSLMAAVAVAEAVTGQGAAPVDIKWPNDVLVGERKLSGILVEGASGVAGAARVILGIGVNLNHRGFPAELAATATSLALVTGRAADPAACRDEVLSRLARWYEALGRDAGAVRARWAELSSYARGAEVAVTLDGRRVVGVTDGITEAGALRLRTPDGEVRTVLAGEVSRLRKSGDA